MRILSVCVCARACGCLCRYEFSARTLPLGDVLAHLGAPSRLDYFSLDIEGAELMVGEMRRRRNARTEDDRSNVEAISFNI